MSRHVAAGLARAWTTVVRALWPHSTGHCDHQSALKSISITLNKFSDILDVMGFTLPNLLEISLHCLISTENNVENPIHFHHISLKYEDFLEVETVRPSSEHCDDSHLSTCMNSVISWRRWVLEGGRIQSHRFQLLSLLENLHSRPKFLRKQRTSFLRFPSFPRSGKPEAAIWWWNWMNWYHPTIRNWQP